MAEETTVLDELLEEQSSEPEERAEEATEAVEEKAEEQELNPGELRQLLGALQKGYTINRQEMAEIRAALQQPQAQATDGEEYVTKSSLREIVSDVLNNRDQAVTNAEVQAREILDDQFNQLVLDGKVRPSEREDFFQHGLDIEEYHDMGKVARSFAKAREAYSLRQSRQTEEQINEKRERGSKVGSSEKAGSAHELSYEQIHRMSMDEL